MAQDGTSSSDERNGIPDDQIAFVPPPLPLLPPVEPATATYDAVALIYDAVLLLGIGATAAVVYFKTRDRNNNERTEKVTFDPQKTTPEQAVKDKVGNQNVPVSPKAQEALSSGKTAPDRADFGVIAKHFRANEGRTYSQSEIEAIQSQVGAPRDGSYGAETAEKVYQWQQTHGLAADGEAGSSTYQAMFGVSRQALIQQQQAAQNLAQRQAKSQAYLGYEANLPQETRADMDGFYQQDPNRAAKIDREVQSRYGKVGTENDNQGLATALRHHIIAEWFTPNNYANQSPQDQAQRQSYLNHEAQLPASTKTDMDAFYSQNAGAATKIDQEVQNRYGQIATRSNDVPLTNAIRHQVIQELYAPSNYTGKSQQGGAVVENPSAPAQEPSTQPEQDPEPGRKPPGDEPPRFPVPGDSSRENRPDLPTLDPLPGQGNPNPNQGPLSPGQPKDPNAPIELPKNPTSVQVPGSPAERPNTPSPNPQEPSTPPIQAERQETQPSSTPNADAPAEEPASTTEPEPENSPDADDFRFKSTGEPLVGRKVSELSPEEDAELKAGYKVTTREDGRTIYTRRDTQDDRYPQIHTDPQADGEWTIQKGPAQENNRISNPYTMDKNFEAAYGEKPEGHQTHHLVTDKISQTNELIVEDTRNLKEQGEKPGIDRAENLIAQPNGATAYNDESPEVQALEDKEALAKIVHNGSHPEWDDHVDELLNEKIRQLERKNPDKTLQEMPPGELRRAVTDVQQTLRQELRDAAQQIKEGNYENLPSWIKPDYVPKDGNGQEFPKISEVPQQVPANTLEASRNITAATLVNNTEQPNPAAAFASPEAEKIATAETSNPETAVISANPQSDAEDSTTFEDFEDEESDNEINEWLQKQIDANRERYPLPQPRAPQALNTTIADQKNPSQSPRESLDSIKESNPSLHDTLSRLNNVIDELDRQTLARQPQSSPAQRLYEKTAQSVTQQTGLNPGHDRFEPVLAAKLLAEHGYNQAASIIAAGSPRLNEVNATFGSTTADRQLAELMKQGEQTLQAMRPEQQKQQDQMEQG
jgi:Putative peptidoglycan binding domain/A nuclease family of the HNH/ENDO VII superfamily with conserved AHH